MSQSNIYHIGGLLIKVTYQSPFLVFDNEGGASDFMTLTQSPEWHLVFNSPLKAKSFFQHTVFKGTQQFEENIPYKWSIHQTEGVRCICIEFQEGVKVHKVQAQIDFKRKSINVTLELTEMAPVALDPFFHPLGVLVLNEIVSESNGFMIHASGVDDGGDGYLFSAVSGTGKTTMANLWSDKNATIINDDRLIVRKEDDGKWRIYNTPMPHYKDVTKSVPLRACFLLKQATENYLKPLNELQGVLGIMGNCIQHLYDEKRVERYISLVQEVVEYCSVYEAGFKPDTDIVDLIRTELGS